MPTVIARPVEDAVSIVSGAEVGHTFVQTVAMGSFMYISLALNCCRPLRWGASCI
jgi:hypothetical protein